MLTIRTRRLHTYITLNYLKSNKSKVKKIETFTKKGFHKNTYRKAYKDIENRPGGNQTQAGNNGTHMSDGDIVVLNKYIYIYIHVCIV